MRLLLTFLAVALLGVGCSFPTTEFHLGGPAADVPVADLGTDLGTAETAVPSDAGDQDGTPADVPIPADAGDAVEVGAPDGTALDTPVTPDDVPVDIVVVDTACSSDAQCDDGDPCTTDTCDMTAGACLHAARMSCCMAASECDDGNACTADTCTANACAHGPIAGCCVIDSDCPDPGACMTHSCNTTTRMCVNAAIAGCCTLNSECDDSNACTMDSCNATHVCEHTGLAGCCTSNMQCDDHSPCTTDTCDTATSTCHNTPIAGCCTSAVQCASHDACLIDSCAITGGAGGTCMHNAVAAPGDGCAHALALTPTATLQTYVTNTACAHNNFMTYAGHDVAFQFTLPAGTWIFYADTAGSAWDTVLVLNSGACPGTQVALDDDHCGLQSTLVAQLAGGSYTLIVDGYNAAASGLVQLHYRAVQVPSGLAVEVPPQAAGQVSTHTATTATFTGTTGARSCRLIGLPPRPICFCTPGSQETQSCTGSTASAPEHVYAVGLCPGQIFHATACPTAGSGYASVLALRPELTGTAGTLCTVGDTTAACSGSATIASAAGTISAANLYFVAVDGNGISCGAYTLTMTGF